MLKEKYRIETAVSALQELTGWEFTVEATEIKRGENHIDGYVVVKNVPFIVETKSKLNHLSISQLEKYKYLLENNEELIFIVDELSDGTKNMLKENHFNYLDIHGNAYIETKDIHLFIERKKIPTKVIQETNKNFTKKGLIVIFHLLNNENLRHFPYRKISEITHTSLDTITQTITKLKQQGFIRQVTDKEMRLANKQVLLEKWIDGYGNILKPSLFLRKFRFQNQELAQNWKSIPLDDNSFWGGEPAADILTDFLVPAIFTLYTKDSQAELMKKYRIFPDENGNIEVYEAFYLTEKQGLSPILVYADLVLSDIARNKEVAQRIKEKYEQEFR